MTSDNYKITYVNGTLTVNAKEIGIVWGENEFTYNGQAHKPMASATGLVNGNMCDITVSGEKTAAGDYTASASAISNSNYKLPASITKAFTIRKAALTVTAKDNSIIFGMAPANNKVTYSGFIGGENELILSGTLAYAINYEQYGNVGQYAITPSGLSSDNYEITYVNGKLDVNVKEIAIEIDSMSSIKGEALKELTYKITSGEFCNGDAEFVKLTKADGADANTYAITGVCDNSNYKVTFTDGVYTILQKIVDDSKNNTGVEIVADKGLTPDTRLVVVVLNTEDSVRNW